MKYLIFDSGPIISMAMNGLLPVIERLKSIFPGEFIITPNVKNEIIDRPMKIKKYKLESMQVKNLLDRGVLKLSTELIPQQDLEKEIKRILKITSGVLRITQTGEKINIIHEGEASCLAFANLCKCDNVIVVDERTTRMLTEAPKNLEKMMEKKLHMAIDAQLPLLNELKQFRFIRSSELVFMAYKKDLLDIKKSKDLLDALLYGVKFKGCAISSEEVEQMKALA